MRRILIVLAAGVALGGFEDATAQGLEGWRWRLDAAAPGATGVPDSASHAERMPPGWHVTTARGALLYHPAEQANGRFSIAADIVVFPSTAESGFGVFVGGAHLDTDSATWLSAQLRRDGAVAVVHRSRGSDHALVPWVVHPAIKPHPGSGLVTHRLRVAVTTDSLRVFVNDSTVARAGIAGIRADGQFGFRFGEGVNLHLTTLDHIRHLAPARR